MNAVHGNLCQYLTLATVRSVPRTLIIPCFLQAGGDFASFSRHASPGRCWVSAAILRYWDGLVQFIKAGLIVQQSD